MTDRRAFTLIELLVVIAIIGVLLAILAPSLWSAISVTKNVVCSNNMQRVGRAFVHFASEHDMTLPGGYNGGWQGPEGWQKSWVGSEVGCASYEGTLLPYIGGVTRDDEVEIYRCPSLEEGVRGSGVGSNGKIDYAQALVFAGTKMAYIPDQARVLDPAAGVYLDTVAPLVVEEDPMYWINRNYEPSHANQDRVGTWHDGGSNVVARGGSVTRLKFTGRGANTYEWRFYTPSGVETNLHHNGWGYGTWHGR